MDMDDKEQPRHDTSHASSNKIRVAVVGTGLAGLVTAYLLHHDEQARFDVTLVEQADTLSLDAASVTLENTITRVSERLNIPPRSVTRGYYPNLTRMYDYLRVPLRRVRYTFVFAETPPPPPPTETRGTSPPRQPDTDVMAGAYFVFEGLHKLYKVVLSPRLRLEWAQQLWQTLFLAICHVWFIACCFLILPCTTQTSTAPTKSSSSSPSPSSAADDDTDTDTDRAVVPSESLRSYLRRIRLPRRYVSHHLLPALCAICTCTHAQMCEFPASDVVDFMKKSSFYTTYMTDGVHELQAKLVQGLGRSSIALRTRVTKVELVDQGVLLSWHRREQAGGDAAGTAAAAAAGGGESLSSETFDRVVLAVTPNVAAALFEPARRSLSLIPTTTVVATVIDPLSSSSSSSSSSKAVISVKEHAQSPSERLFSRHDRPQLMSFRSTNTTNTNTTTATVDTEAWHFLPTGAICRTGPPSSTLPYYTGAGTVLHTATFTRTLRTVQSKDIVERIVVVGAPRKRQRSESQAQSASTNNETSDGEKWTNGSHNVWLVGSWCWDGLVLLEGCVVSAMRIADAFGVVVPWDKDAVAVAAVH